MLRLVRLARRRRAPGFPPPDLGRVRRPRRCLFEIASPPVSSSEVRARIAAGEPIDGLVPPAVARAIEEHGLYRGYTDARTPRTRRRH